MQKPRVRFAPSPTGQLHVGNARTALYNWLFARRFGGDFLLRVEDTDIERSEARYEAQLLDDLRWLGLDWDEGPEARNGEGPYGPYRQSERLEIYREHTDRLLAEGLAYRCFCSAEQLDREREQAIAAHLPQVYSGRCRNISPDNSASRAAAGEPFAVRLKIGLDPIAFHDIVRGAVEFAADAVSDPILVRSSGMPVYNYVVTIDDALMKITHVIRGDDHLSNTPKQVAIYQAFRLDGAGVRTSLHHSWAGQNAAFEASWSDFDRDVSRDGCTAGSADKLPGIARMGSGGRHSRDIYHV